MENSTQQILGIETSSYQKRAEACVGAFVKSFKPTAKNFSLKITSEHETPYSFRVHNNPPSLQIRRLPEGGQNQGTERIRTLLSQKIEDNDELLGGLLLTENFASSFPVAHESDLTRECIIVTLADETISLILQSRLISPTQISDVLQSLKQGHPEYFVIFQRYLMGIEQTDGVKVPFGLVTAQDEKTLTYLEELPLMLRNLKLP